MFAHQITLCMIYLYLARHGETQENVAQILQGHMPGHLTPQGREQAANLRDQLVKSGIHFDVLLYSDLRRTHRLQPQLHLQRSTEAPHPRCFEQHVRLRRTQRLLHRQEV